MTVETVRFVERRRKYILRAVKETVHNSASGSEFEKTLSGDSLSLAKVSILASHDISTSNYTKDLEKIPEEN